MMTNIINSRINAITKQTRLTFLFSQIMLSAVINVVTMINSSSTNSNNITNPYDINDVWYHLDNIYL